MGISAFASLFPGSSPKRRSDRGLGGALVASLCALRFAFSFEFGAIIPTTKKVIRKLPVQLVQEIERVGKRRYWGYRKSFFIDNNRTY